MERSQIRLNINDFRAIKNADIVLNGITVVAGENGCGKSTLSKFLYYVFKYSGEYEFLVKKELSENLREALSFLRILSDEILRYEIKNRDSEELIRESIQSIHAIIDKLKKAPADIDSSYWFYIIDELYTRFKNHSYQEGEPKIRLNRIQNILSEILNSNYTDTESSDIDFQNQLTLLKEHINKYYSQAKQHLSERPSKILINSLSKIFNGDKLPEVYSISEYGAPIISSESDILLESHYIQQVAYIDTPMLLGINQTSDADHWDETNHILQQTPNQEYDNEINKIISHEILKGDTSYEKDKITQYGKSFIYKREDGSEFDLLNCATGIKSFAMLQMMLKNGFIDKYTLLIIDEPESHLHPQWIVEYARLIVLLNKHIGVKFFIASHNPDMVSAIKYISEAEETDNNLNFYVADRNSPSYTYSYKHLGTDVEAIFESFNIALDRINLYGTRTDQK